MFDIDDIQQVLSNAGLQSLGIANPSLSVKWTVDAGATLTEGASGTLHLVSTNNWVAPLGGILHKTNGTDRIIQPTGSPVPSNALVLQVHPMIHLRLKRFYAAIIEGRTSNTEHPERPVPYYFVYVTRDDVSAVTGGKYGAGEDLGFSGTLTVHDEHGMAIDPVAVAGIFDQLVTAHPVLEDKELISTAPTSSRQITDIGQLGTTHTRAHLVNPYGQAYEGSDLQNITLLAQGVYSVDNPAAAITAGSGAPDDLRLGSAANGTLSTTYTIHPAASGISLHRDFVRVYVVDLKQHLLGEVDAADPASSLEERPPVRHNEAVQLHLNGNASLGGVNELINGTPDDLFVVSPRIQGDFTLPADATEAVAQWPSFPPGTNPTSGPIPASLKEGFNPVAHFVDGSAENTDVVVTIDGLTDGQAVRGYSRWFLPDAREGRGGGAGGVAQVLPGDSTAKVALLLEDPLDLRRWGTSVSLPTDPTLHLDVVVIHGDGQARVFGNVTAVIGAPAALTTEESALLGTANNGLPGAEFQAISSAGILGIEPVSTSLSPASSALDTVLALLSEGTPRDSPRLPTMARRDCMVAQRTGSTFRGQLSGMHLVADAVVAQQRKGSPGGNGGREFRILSAQTDAGLLGYDLNRAAFRRCKNLIERLVALGENDWNTPAASTGGSISAALLQTIASGVETPELSIFSSQLSSFFSTHTTWSSVVDWIENQLGLGSWPASIAGTITSQLANLRSSGNAARLYDEFKREFVACVYGRRDAFWSLKHAFNQAREFVYIEGPAFTRTDYGSTATADLLTTLKNRMGAQPGLRVIAALSKELDYGQGYDTFAAREYTRRREAIDFIDELSTTTKKRIAAFHPIGFPGRPLELMTNVIIVDDVFALIGSSTLRRKGLTFDGGQDIVLFDRTMQSGKSLAIREFRRSIMGTHINAAPPEDGAMPDPNWVRLASGNQAFEVFRELLDSGGAGVIEDIWNGQVPGTPEIAESSFPDDDIADPDGRNFETLAGILVTALASAASPPAWP